MKTTLLLLALSISGSAAATAPDPPPRTTWMRHACALEDGVDCFWNAAQQGDGRGHSFYVHRFPGGTVCTMYVNPTYARRHDQCRSG